MHRHRQTQRKLQYSHQRKLGLHQSVKAMESDFNKFDLNESCVIQANNVLICKKVNLKPREDYNYYTTHSMVNKTKKKQQQLSKDYDSLKENYCSQESSCQSTNHGKQTRKQSQLNHIVQQPKGIILENQKQNSAYRWITQKYSPHVWGILIPYIQGIRFLEIEDVPRTSQYFDQAQQNKLQNILACLNTFDPQVGYVQGLNFIAGSLLYYAEEEWLTFWLLNMLTEQLETRDIYIDDMPGLQKHNCLLKFLIKIYLPELYLHIVKCDLPTQLFFNQWLLSLMTQMMPMQSMEKYFENLFKQGWIFFYRFVLALLKHLTPQLLSMDSSDMLIKLTQKQYNLQKKDTTWEKMLGMTVSKPEIDFPVGFITFILDCYDKEDKVFQQLCPPKSCDQICQAFYSFIQQEFQQ